MTNVKRRVLAVMSVVSVVAVLAPLPSSAQPSGFGWGPGMMMGPGMMGPGRFGMWGRGMCDPRAAGLAEWRIAAIERAVRPTDAQKPKLDELKTASTKAAETIAAACPKDIPRSPVDRLVAMEQRLDAMLQAVKTVRPAFEAFYSSLTKEQQARLDTAGPRRWGWQGWRWRWNER